MTTNPLTEPTEQRRHLAALLVRLRRVTGLSQTEFGKRARGMNQPKVSRLETGRQLPDEDDLQAWADAAGADDQTRQQLTERLKAALVEAASWEDELRHGFAAKQARTAHAEQSVSTVRVYSLIVPGLLQTAEYARRLINMQASLHHDLFGDPGDALAAWMERQQALYQPGHYEFVVPESALRWRPGPGGDAVLAAQLHHLVAMSARPVVRLGVIPDQLGGVVCVPHEFTILGEPGVDTDVEVAIYTTTRELHIREPAEIAIYMDLWARLVDQAVFGDDARVLISQLAAVLGG